ncbi:MAG: hypothetical protein ABW321_34160 [Polyangiales bacterium]
MKDASWWWMVCVGLWLAPMPTRADAGWVQLVWQRPLASTCPATPVLQHDVELLLGRPVFTSQPNARLLVQGSVSDAATGVRVQLEARNAGGERLGMRELNAPPGECGVLREDIALVLTLLIEHAERELDGPARFSIGLSGALALNVFPRAAVGVGPALLVKLGALQLRAEGYYWIPLALRTAGGIGAELQAASLVLRLCPRIAGEEAGHFSAWLCAGANVGVLFAQQTQPGQHATQLRLLAQGLVELRGALQLGRDARLEAGVGPLLSLHRTRLVSVRDDGAQVDVYRAPTFGLIFTLAFII